MDLKKVLAVEIEVVHSKNCFWEHRCSILNYGQFTNPTPVSFQHFNQADHSNNILLIPLELICSNCDSVRKAQKAHFISKSKQIYATG